MYSPLFVCILVFTSLFAFYIFIRFSRVEHFINTMEEQALFDVIQNTTLFDTNTIPMNNALFQNVNLKNIVSIPDTDLPFSPDIDFSKIFTKDTTEDYRSADSFCKQFSKPSDFPKRTNEDIACGWWYISEPSMASIPAIGTPKGPLFPNQTTGQWIWDLEQAEKLEEFKTCRRIQHCPSLSLDDFKGKCGWCEYKGYGVPISKGVEKFPNESLSCDEKILINPNECESSESPQCGDYGHPSLDRSIRLYTEEECKKMGGNYTSDSDCISQTNIDLGKFCKYLNDKPTVPLPLPLPITNSSSIRLNSIFGKDMKLLQDPVSSQIGGLSQTCKLNQYGYLGLSCLKELAKGQFVSPGTIMRTLENPGTPLTENDMLALQILNEAGLSIPKNIFGNATDIQELGNFLNSIYNTMLTGKTPLIRAAATVFVNGDTSAFDPCANTSSAISRSIPCLQRMFRQVGCQASGKAYPTTQTADTYTNLSLPDIKSKFQNLYESMSSNDYTVQDESVKNCIGVQFHRTPNYGSPGF